MARQYAKRCEIQNGTLVVLKNQIRFAADFRLDDITLELSQQRPKRKEIPFYISWNRSIKVVLTRFAYHTLADANLTTRASLQSFR